jgi:uncharacterized membrane protein
VWPLQNVGSRNGISDVCEESFVVLCKKQPIAQTNVQPAQWRRTLRCLSGWSFEQFNLLEISMNQRALIAATAATLMTFALASAPVAAQEKEKCYGIAKAGQNDCANLSGTHSCAGQSKVDMGKDEWKYVAKGTCKTMKGMSADESKKLKS